jgi:UDP-glucose 4-epimerase
VNPYGESKLMVEKMLHWYQGAYGLRFAALRYFNAAGADPDGEVGEDHDPETHLIPLTIDAALGRRPGLDIYGTDYPSPMVQRFATTSMSPIWRTHTCWLSIACKRGPTGCN